MSLSPKEAGGFLSRKYHAVGQLTLSIWGKRLSAGLAGLFHRMSPRGPRSARKYHALWRGTLCRYGRKRRLAGDLPSHTALAARALARAFAASLARIRPKFDELCRYGLERRLAGVSRAPPPRPALALCVDVFWSRGWFERCLALAASRGQMRAQLDRPCPFGHRPRFAAASPADRRPEALVARPSTLQRSHVWPRARPILVGVGPVGLASSNPPPAQRTVAPSGSDQGRGGRRRGGSAHVPRWRLVER